MTHPPLAQLALYAGRDLSLIERLRASWHLRGCPQCRRQVAGFEASREALRRDHESLPAGLNWDSLAREMTGNIRVGLAAGECVSEVRATPQPAFLWRPAAAVLALGVVISSAWWLNVPAEQKHNLTRSLEQIFNRGAHPASENGIFFAADRSGIQVQENGAAFTLMHPNATPAVISVSTQGTVGASFVDADTGQVTVNNVYGQ